MKYLFILFFCFSLSAQDLPVRVHIDCIYNIRNNKLEKIKITPIEPKEQEGIEWDKVIDWTLFKDNLKEQLNLVFDIEFKNGNR